MTLITNRKYFYLKRKKSNYFSFNLLIKLSIIQNYSNEKHNLKEV